MERTAVKSVGVPFAECERILSDAKEKGKDAIYYKAVTGDGKPLHVTNLHGQLDTDFFLVLTVEKPEETAVDKPEEEAKSTDKKARAVVDKLVDALGLAIFATSILEEDPCQDYCRGQVEGLKDWMRENGLASLLLDVLDKAIKHAAASLHL